MSAGANNDWARFENAITLLRARIDEEFRIAERLDAKARQSATIALAFFAITQTVVLNGLARSDPSMSGRPLVVVLAVASTLAALACIHRLTVVEDTRPEGDVSPQQIQDWAWELDDRRFAEQLVVQLRVIAEARAASNAVRNERYEAMVKPTRFSLIATAVELVGAVALSV